MLKIVRCDGDFNSKIVDLFNEKRINNGLDPLNDLNKIERHDELLIETVEEGGKSLNDDFNSYDIEEIPIEYKDIYSITYNGGNEIIECDFKDLLIYKYQNLDVDNCLILNVVIC